MFSRHINLFGGVGFCLLEQIGDEELRLGDLPQLLRTSSDDRGAQ
jgi:hypothetical protein